MAKTAGQALSAAEKHLQGVLGWVVLASIAREPLKKAALSDVVRRLKAAASELESLL